MGKESGLPRAEEARVKTRKPGAVNPLSYSFSHPFFFSFVFFHPCPQPIRFCKERATGPCASDDPDTRIAERLEVTRSRWDAYLR